MAVPHTSTHQIDFDLHVAEGDVIGLKRLDTIQRPIQRIVRRGQDLEYNEFYDLDVLESWWRQGGKDPTTREIIDWNDYDNVEWTVKPEGLNPNYVEDTLNRLIALRHEQPARLEADRRREATARREEAARREGPQDPIRMAEDERIAQFHINEMNFANRVGVRIRHDDWLPHNPLGQYRFFAPLNVLDAPANMDMGIVNAIRESMSEAVNRPHLL